MFIYKTHKINFFQVKKKLKEVGQLGQGETNIVYILK